MITEASPRSLGSTPTETTFVGAGAGGGKGGGMGGNNDVATGGLSLGALSSKSAGRTRLTSSLSGELDELPALRIIPRLGRCWFRIISISASASLSRYSQIATHDGQSC